MPRKKETYALAQRIALDLFTNGNGQQADHLALMQLTRNLGGWGLVPFTDRLCDLLDETPLPDAAVAKGRPSTVTPPARGKVSSSNRKGSKTVK